MKDSKKQAYAMADSYENQNHYNSAQGNKTGNSKYYYN